MITTEECFELAKRFGLASTYDSLVYLDFVDARFVLRQALQMDDWEDFLTNIDGIPGYDEHADVVPVDLVVDNTGKLAKLLLEYLRSKEHDSDNANCTNHIDEVFSARNRITIS